jgi:hypothetical protein
MSKAVFCLSDSEVQAGNIVTELKSAGFSNNDISVLFPDKAGTKDFAHEQHTKAPEGAATGAGTGGFWVEDWDGSSASDPWRSPGSAHSSPPDRSWRLWPVQVSAPQSVANGSLVGMGIPEYEAKRYEGKIREGNILISVHSETAKKENAPRIFLSVPALTTSRRPKKRVFPRNRDWLSSLLANLWSESAEPGR